MKREDRFYRPEELTEEQKDQFFEGLDKYLDQKWADEDKRKAEAKAKRDEEIASGKITVMNGRQFLTELLNVESILTAYHMSQAELSRRFDIPVRTIQNWVTSGANRRSCPMYVLKMMVEILEREA